MKEFEPDDLGVLSIKDVLQDIRQDFLRFVWNLISANL